LGEGLWFPGLMPWAKIRRPSGALALGIGAQTSETNFDCMTLILST
jgi:hypothetical protein